ncbi:MAG: ABC transporter transmembrane domain-containing protein, partial [Terracidiphilus sp.]
MKRLVRLLRFGLPYWLEWLPGVFLLAMVGLLESLRIVLFVPILGVVLEPHNQSNELKLFPTAPTGWQFDIHSFVPHQLHNAWTVVAFALVISTVLKGLSDYAGTYLVNYAGFGMITDLRNHLYEVTLRRSSGFFHRHPTGSILSTLINDVDRVQNAVSSVLGDFLQQFFTFIFTLAAVIALGGRLSWALLLFVPVIVTSSRRIGRSVRTRTRTGQDKLAEIQNILHETVTGNNIVRAFNTEIWEILRFKNAAHRLFRANLRSVRIQSISSPLMDTIGAVAIALLLWVGRNEILHGRMTAAIFITFIVALFKLYDPVRKFAFFYNSFQQAMGASISIFSYFDAEDDV